MAAAMTRQKESGAGCLRRFIIDVSSLYRGCPPL
jgi:hypothetical protein